jgi:WD40 repeat protein
LPPALSFRELPSGEEVLRAVDPDPGLHNVPAARLSPDGTLLAYRGHLHALDTAWERLSCSPGIGLRSEPPVSLGQLLDLQGGSPSDLAFSADGRLLAVGEYHGVALWDVPAQQCLKRRPDVGCLSVALAPDNTLAVALFMDRAVALWASGLRACLARLEHSNEVICVAFSPDGTTLATMTTHPSKVRLWDVASRRCVAQFKAFRTWARTLAFHPGGRLLAAGAGDGQVRLWDTTTHKEVACLDWQIGFIRALAFSSDGMTAAVAGSGNVVVLWDVEEP